jgi:hypothetical protein
MKLLAHTLLVAFVLSITAGAALADCPGHAKSVQAPTTTSSPPPSDKG